MPKLSSSNKTFELAADIICNTSQSVFLTGRAGTGKTTFLHYIKEYSNKNMIVAAPTGIAAINAGGVTLHSVFQLPFESFQPTLESKKRLDSYLKFRKSKIELIRELELLIIDEVSMLRADTLDAIDYVLKRYRDSSEPFGGIQVLFIGDLFQLPPVVQKDEWQSLQKYYPSPFFYNAYALDNNQPLLIELKQVYRQSDSYFIDILNKVRKNSLTGEDLKNLNAKYDPYFQRSLSDGYIVLTTHNSKADKINFAELSKLKETEYVFHGSVKGDFNESFFPTDSTLALKIGAQVMFIKNDTGDQRRFYNGKLGTISRLTSTQIFVCFSDGIELEVEKEVWKNVQYKLDENSLEIKEKEIGQYIQYPIRLAWAITIHKSQGLTFDKVIIDAGQAFAPGQVYVALSRSRSLEGIVLHSKITQDSIKTSEEALSYTKNEQSEQAIISLLNAQKSKYCAKRLLKVFQWNPVVRTIQSLLIFTNGKMKPNNDNFKVLLSELSHKVFEEQTIAINFQKELNHILDNDDINLDLLKERVCKAASYFHHDLLFTIVKPLELQLERLILVAKTKQLQKEVQKSIFSLKDILQKLENIFYGDILLTKDIIFEVLEKEKLEKPNMIITEKKTKQKGDSKRITLKLFKENKSIEEIAIIRELAKSTIESHLASFILSGDLLAEDLIPKEKLNLILSTLNKSHGENFTIGVVKENLPQDYTYFDIRVAMNYSKFLEKSKI